ncbi:MAG: ECF transporter S component [Coprobacillus sp.]|nr:ECF transporter S component [Coprobacillus sp.]
MSGWNQARIIIGAVALVLILLALLVRGVHFKNHMTVRFITRTAIFSAIAAVLYVVPFLHIPLPIFPSFLEIHIDEIPALIASFAYGPLMGTFVVIVKTLVKLPFTTTLGVGELADLIYGLVLVIPAGFYYKHHRTFKGCLVACLIAVVLQVAVASIITSFPILDFYMFVMGFSEEQLLYMCQLVNPNVTSLGWTFCLWVALPFNLLKDAIVVVVTLLLYRSIHRMVENAKKE